MRVFLTGFMGSGKTTVGRHVAAALGLPFIDLDTVVEARAGMEIPRIFETVGESAFRKLEREALKEVCDGPETVVATGGGTPTTEENRGYLRRGVTVWLRPSFDTILSRLTSGERSRRPLFFDPQQAKALYERRRADYRRADLEIEVEPLESPQAVASRIVQQLGERRCAI